MAQVAVGAAGEQLGEGPIVVGYGRPATDALARVIAAAQAEDPLATVTVVVPSNLAGVVARRVIGARRGLANVAFLTPLGLTEQLARRRIAAEHRPALTEPVLLAAIRVELGADPGFFAPVAGHAATERALARRFVELSRTTGNTRQLLAARGSPRARALVELFERVAGRLADHAGEEVMVHHALEAVAAGGREVDELGTVILALPQPTPPGPRRVLTAVRAARPGTTLVALTGDAAADAPVRAECGRLGVEIAETAPGSDQIVPATGTGIISASDVDEEARAVTRRLLELLEQGVPPDRIALLIPSVDPYARIVAAHLDAAGITWNGATARTLADAMAGRMLSRLLALVGSRFARDALIALLASVPVRTPNGAPVAIDRWDRISRRAGVVDGDDWTERLARHAAELDQQAGDRDSAGLGGAPGLRGEADATRALADFAADLRARLAGLEGASGWAALAVQSRAALDQMLDVTGEDRAWPESEREAYDAIVALLDRCDGLDQVEPAPSFATFAAAVTHELGAPAGRIGRYGVGVSVGPITSAIGLDLDAVFVLGLSEGQFPIARREDALLADPDRALAPDGELTTRETAIADQLRSYRAALAAAADHRILSFARGDLRSARERVPSRLLLETASTLHRSRVFTSDFSDLGAADGVDVVASFSAGLGLIHSAASATEHDLGEIGAFVAGGGDVAAHPLVVGSPVSVGVEAARGRASVDLTRWDGNVGAVVDAVPSPAKGEVVSATRLETWAECPMRYFLGQVLRVPVESEPERLLELSPLDRGTLVHTVLERFVGEELDRSEAERAAPDPQRSFDRMREIMDEEAATAEAKGLTGKAVLWALHRESIEADLAQTLVLDLEHRAATGEIPVAVELAFGFDGAPPLRVALPDGASVAFRGRADRVDRAPDGSLVVLDYKTGGTKPVPNEAKADPVAWGRKLQLPVYAAAAREQLGAPAATGAYWYISEKGGFGMESLPLDAPTDERFRAAVGGIVAGIEAGAFPAAPGEESWFAGTGENCAYCDYDAICPGTRVAQADAKADAAEVRFLHALAPEPADGAP